MNFDTGVIRDSSSSIGAWASAGWMAARAPNDAEACRISLRVMVMVVSWKTACNRSPGAGAIAAVRVAESPGSAVGPGIAGPQVTST